MKKINSLNGMRFWMMAVIMLSHCEFLRDSFGSSIYDGFLHNSSVAVDYFFMLSGFGMAYNYIEHKPYGIIDSIKFAIGKIKKIYLIYLVCLVVCIPICIGLALEGGQNIIKAFATNGAKFLLNITMLQSSTGIEQLSHGLNAVSWFLSCLFILYICAPFILRFCSRIKKSAKNIIIMSLACMVLMITAYGILGMIEERTFFNDLTYGSPYIRVFYLLFGIICANIIHAVNNKGEKIYSYLNGITVILNIVWYCARENLVMNNIYKYIIDVIMCCSLLITLALSDGIVSRILSNKTHLYLGQIAMYLFLIHYPIRLYIVKGIKMLEIKDTPFVGIVETILIFGLSIFIAALINWTRNKKVKET